MTRPNLSPKRIATDIAGFACIIAAPLIGWLPGPGGIPLFIAGLALLSIHNPWAERLLHFVRERSENMREILFPDNSLVQWGWDILVVMLIGVGTLISLTIDSRILRSSSIAIYALATTIFMFNRHRLKWLDIKLKRRKQY